MSNSSADPLPTAFWRPNFRCWQARANLTQVTKKQHSFGVERRFLGAERRVFPDLREMRCAEPGSGCDGLQGLAADEARQVADDPHRVTHQ